MIASHDEILAFAMGDAAPEVAARVKRAIQSDPVCARVYARSLELAAVASGESQRLDHAFDAAFAASMNAVRANQAAPVVQVRRVPSIRRVSAWGSLAAAACAVVAGSLFAVAPSALKDSQIAPHSASDSSVSFVAFTAASAVKQEAFASLASGVSAVKSGGTVSIAHGTSPETLRIDKPVRLVASDGPVVIGIRSS